MVVAVAQRQFLVRALEQCSSSTGEHDVCSEAPGVSVAAEPYSVAYGSVPVSDYLFWHVARPGHQFLSPGGCALEESSCNAASDTRPRRDGGPSASYEGSAHEHE